MIEVPYLRHESAVRLHQPRNLLLEKSHCHAVGHHQRQRVVPLHLCRHIFLALVAQQHTTSGMVFGKGSDIEDGVVKEKQVTIIGLSVFPDFGEGVKFTGRIHLQHVY